MSFPAVAARLDYPMVVVTTTAAGDRRSGCLVGFTSQVSIDPARFLVGLSVQNHTFTVAQQASHLAVHLLRRDQRSLAALFGGETGDETDKFARCRWHDGPHGMPILDDAPAWFVGAIRERLPLGDHVGHVIDPTVTQPAPPFPLLMFSDVRDLDPGHEA